MNKKLLDFIKTLSKEDPKTLVQKTLKTTEEVGELAKAVLPFINSPQSSHRFSDKEKILEECSDVILGALSVAYNLGMSDEQIENMLWKKSEYWASLQVTEKTNPFPLPFEIHVTVDKETNFNLFSDFCIEQLKVKPIKLDLIDTQKNYLFDEVMTSSKFFGNNLQAYEEIQRISNGLKSKGFKIVREKIETVWWHPAVKYFSNNLNDKSYLESHIDVLIKSDIELSFLQDKTASYGAVLSHNTKKINEDGSKKMIITIRSNRIQVDEFKNLTKKLHSDLKLFGFSPEKEQIEFAIYDTNINQDKDWIKLS